MSSNQIARPSFLDPTRAVFLMQEASEARATRTGLFTADHSPFFATKVADLSMMALKSVGGWIIPKAFVCVSTDLTLERSGAGRATLFAFPTGTMAPAETSEAGPPLPTERPAIPS